MNEVEETEHGIYLELLYRYERMAGTTPSAVRVIKMMQEVVRNHNTWPKDKTGRWVGYAQCLLIEVEGVTTTQEERDFTRPLFHKLYAAQGYDIPETVDIGKDDDNR